MTLAALRSFLVHFPLVAATVAAGTIVAVLLATGQASAAQWTASAYESPRV
ncbi:hypothetical protein NG702_20180 [Pseudarthrobacter sp. MDT3-28]|uniref:hypothetical protein n=1 Tax=Pseudarthrobacter raffinosi TaxID=2953651 RepID=UPI00208E8D3D|nr:hypothetical protein [Pseudarthrobacter sp. MDT3-28]MCO4239688.1 hypothetical protein [Pseudarthrobacter sp. MDT3-28]